MSLLQDLIQYNPETRAQRLTVVDPSWPSKRAEPAAIVSSRHEPSRPPDWRKRIPNVVPSRQAPTVARHESASNVIAKTYLPGPRHDRIVGRTAAVPQPDPPPPGGNSTGPTCRRRRQGRMAGTGGHIKRGPDTGAVHVSSQAAAHGTPATVADHPHEGPTMTPGLARCFRYLGGTPFPGTAAR